MVDALLQKKILIIDDGAADIVILQRLLTQAGYTDLSVLQEPRDAAERFRTFQPDLVLVDFHMPAMNGLEVIEILRPQLSEYFPIVMLTADERPELRESALAGGARDFINKPFNGTEVKLRIRNLLEAAGFRQQLESYNTRLAELVHERTHQLEGAQVEMLIRLAKASEYRDDESGEHVWRVARTASMLARELGLHKDLVELILRAARLHDVGKIAIPDGILLKPGRLTDAEFEVVKSHTTVGANLLSGGRSELMKMAELITRSHHERWDGGGYPSGLAGNAIPLEGRILAAADTYDVLTHDRPFQRAMAPEAAMAEITKNRGSQFDPTVVDAFVKLFAKGELADIATPEVAF